MASGYILGSVATIPLQITEGGIAFTGEASPTIVKIIGPSGTALSGYPQSMSEADRDYGLYSYSFTPEKTGNYLVILTYEVSGQTYTAMEHIIVGTGSAVHTAPRAIAL